MTRKEAITSQLLKLMKQRKFVRFKRTFEDGFVRGSVLDVGPKFFMMAVMSGQVRFDGFSCFRISDVRSLNLDPYAAFTEAAMKKLKEHSPKKPRVGVTNIERLLLDANKQFPLVTIHRESVKPDVCWIGRIQQVKDRQVSLLEIGPDAKWDSELTRYKVSEVTKIDFGGDYERALHLVGGKPPRVC